MTSTDTDRLAEKPPYSDRELERLGELVANGCFDEHYKGVKGLYEAVMYERALVQQLQTENAALRKVWCLCPPACVECHGEDCECYEHQPGTPPHELKALVQQLQGQLAEVARLHQPIELGGRTVCSSCADGYGESVEWPCDDAEALELGEESTKTEVPDDAAPVTVYGASDDLIEVRGTVDDELGAYDNPKTLRVDIVGGQHVWLQVEYDPDGTGEWRIQSASGHGRVLDFGHELVTIIPARGEDEGDDEDGCPGRSDKAIVRGGIAVNLDPEVPTP